MKQQQIEKARGTPPNSDCLTINSLLLEPFGENCSRLDSFHLMTSTSDTDSSTAAEPVQILTPPPSPLLVEDDATTTATPPPTPAAAKKKKKKKSKKSNKAKDAVTSPSSPSTPVPTAEENQPPPLYISRNKHWKYISSFHVRIPLCSGVEVLKFYTLSRDHGYSFPWSSSSLYSS